MQRTPRAGFDFASSAGWSSRPFVTSRATTAWIVASWAVVVRTPDLRCRARQASPSVDAPDHCRQRASSLSFGVLADGVVGGVPRQRALNSFTREWANRSATCMLTLTTDGMPGDTVRMDFTGLTTDRRIRATADPRWRSEPNTSHRLDGRLKTWCRWPLYSLTQIDSCPLKR